MNKKIVFIHLLNDYSGSPKVLAQVVKVFKNQGHDISLFTAKGEHGFLSGIINDHYTYFYKRYENKYLTLVMFMISQISLFFKLLKYRNSDVLIYVNTMLPFGAGLAGKFMKKSVCYHVHESHLKPVMFKRFLRLIIQKTANKVIFVSKSLAASESFDTLDQEVIYNAFQGDLVELAESNKYEWKKQGNFNVLMICSMKDYKGVNEFLSIASACIEIKHLKFNLLLGADQVEMEDYFKRRNVPENVKLISKKKDVVPYYQNTSLLLNLSRVDQWIETFGLTIIEAMAFGIPVIVPPVGGPAEIVTDGKEGYLISSYEIDKIVHKIVFLSENEKICLKMSDLAKKRSGDFEECQFAQAILTSVDELSCKFENTIKKLS